MAKKRKMPSKKKVLEYWNLSDICVKCGHGGKIVRAHIIDRWTGSISSSPVTEDELDTVENVLPLCSVCHEQQPVFYLDEWVEAMAWFFNDGHTFAKSIVKKQIEREGEYPLSVPLEDVEREIGDYVQKNWDENRMGADRWVW